MLAGLSSWSPDWHTACTHGQNPLCPTCGIAVAIPCCAYHAAAATPGSPTWKFSNHPCSCCRCLGIAWCARGCCSIGSCGTSTPWERASRCVTRRLAHLQGKAVPSGFAGGKQTHSAGKRQAGRHQGKCALIQVCALCARARAQGCGRQAWR